MNYVITRAVLGRQKQVPITNQEYRDIKKAKQGTVEIVAAEETWDTLRENYYEFESQLLALTARGTVFAEADYNQLMSERLRVGRLLANLLSACRAYLDVFPHHLGAIFGKQDPRIAACDGLRRTLHSQRFGYRFMEALRNYSQHRGSPVHSVSFEWKHRSHHGFEFVYHPKVNVDQLRADGMFSKKVVAEIDAGAIPVDKHGGADLKPLVREYLQAIAEVHEELRRCAMSDARAWETEIENAIGRFLSAAATKEKAGIALAKVNPNRTLGEVEYLVADLLDRRRRLQQKNALAQNGADRFVSGRRR